MFVHDVGAGPTIVFIPGLGADHSMYAPQVEALTEFRRIAVDLPGCGASESLHDVPDDRVMEVQTASLADALRARGVTRAHLVGVSYGGVVVQEFLLRYPELTASALISDSFCDTTPETLLQRFMMAAARLQPLPLRLIPRSWWPALNRPIYGKRWPLAMEMITRLFETADLDDLIKQRRVVNNTHLERRLRTTSVPARCLVGDYSTLAVAMMQRTQRAIPGATLQIIPDSFDPSNLCQPEPFTDEVRTWVHQIENS